MSAQRSVRKIAAVAGVSRDTKPPALWTQEEILRRPRLPIQFLPPAGRRRGFEKMRQSLWREWLDIREEQRRKVPIVGWLSDRDPSGGDIPLDVLAKMHGLTLEELVGMVDRVCEQLAAGVPMTRICEDPNLPSSATIMHLKAHNSMVREVLHAARRAGAELLVDKAMVSAEEDDPRRAYILSQTFRWAAARFDPDTFGDRTRVQVEGGDLKAAIERGRQRALERAQRDPCATPLEGGSTQLLEAPRDSGDVPTD